jgi:hypothetical protein
MGGRYSSFCFFLYPVARYMWSMVSHTLGGPGNFSQYFGWIFKHVSDLKNIHVVGAAALC